LLEHGCKQGGVFPMTHPQEDFLRQQAERCFRLADKLSDPDAARELRTIAQAFLEKAADLDRKQGEK